MALRVKIGLKFKIGIRVKNGMVVVFTILILFWKSIIGISHKFQNGLTNIQVANMKELRSKNILSNNLT
jgi:hypothetical protein